MNQQNLIPNNRVTLRQISQLLPWVFFAACVLMVFLYQVPRWGFEPGHHGNVTGHGISIALNSTAESGFVGYANRIKTAENTIQPDYFDRYPIFFSAITGAILRAGEPDTVTRIQRARFMMNLIHVATLSVLFVLLIKLGFNAWLALTVMALVASNYFFITYRDMFHFDQPAILGMLLMWLGLQDYQQTGRKRWLYGLTVFACLWGRSYALFGTFVAWGLWELAVLLKAHIRHPLILIKTAFRLEVTKLGILCLTLLAALLIYNVAMEAYLTNVSWLQTSVIESAMRRVGPIPPNTEALRAMIEWPVAFLIQTNWVWLGFEPFMSGRIFYENIRQFGFLSVAALVVVLVGAGGYLIKTAPPKNKLVIWVMLTAAMFWFLLMRKLFIYHDYVSMYFIGTWAIVWLAILHGIIWHKIYPVLAVAAVGLWGYSLILNYQGWLPFAKVITRESQSLDPQKAGLPPGIALYVSPEVFQNKVHNHTFQARFPGYTLAYDPQLSDAQIIVKETPN